MPKKAKISFNMEDIDDITDQLVEVKNNFYTRPTNTTRGSLRFSIPVPLKNELDLKAGDACFFCQYSEGYYISFKHKPETATKAQSRSRNLVASGQGNTLYLCIPPFIKNLYKETITSVKLIRTKGFQDHEWQIQFLSTECT